MLCKSVPDIYIVNIIFLIWFENAIFKSASVVIILNDQWKFIYLKKKSTYIQGNEHKISYFIEFKKQMCIYQI